MPNTETVRFRVTADHIVLLKNLCMRTAVLLRDDGCSAPFEACPDVNKKRPFGNSGEYACSVLETLGREPDPDGVYRESEKAFARQLLIELPIAYEAVMAHGIIEPGIMPVCRYKALFEYKGRRCLEYWRGAILDFCSGHPDDADRLIEFLMNARSDEPMHAVYDLGSYTDGCGWARAAHEALMRQAVRNFKAAHPEHAGDSDASVMNGLASGSYKLNYGPSNVLHGVDHQKGGDGNGES